MNARADFPATPSGASRRDFLKTSGALIVSASMFGFESEALAQIGTVRPPLVPGELDSWVAVLKDGSVSAFYGKIDMGHALDVAIAQIVAEELDVRFESVTVFQGDTATSCNQGGASGSTGISTGAKPLRSAAAEARRILVETASKQLSVPVDQLSVLDGVVSGGGKRVSYAELIGGRFFNSKVEWNKQVGNFMDIKVPAKLKNPSEYKVVGKSFRRRDVPNKVFGTMDWVTEIRVPGMLHARVIRPTIAGAVPLKVDADSIRKIPGAKLVREKNFLAVVAPREWDAVRAARDLKVEWSAPTNPYPAMNKLYEHIRAAKVVKAEAETNKGDVDAAFKTAARVIEAEYEWPFQSHASMGPACAVADVRADSATLWTGSQKPHYARDGVAALLGLPAEKVHAIWVMGPGSYGRNDGGDAAIDAALLSKLTGKPVRVQGSRSDATAWDPKGPASVHRARAALDASGKVIAFQYTSKGFSRTHIATNESDPRDSLAGQELGMAANPVAAFGTPEDNYGFDNCRLDWESIAPLLDRTSPLRTSHLRDPVGPDLHFGSEQFIDELAVATGEDSVAFRIKYASKPRAIAALKAVAAKAGWQTRVSGTAKSTGDILTGRGIAYTERRGTVVATVAEVEVNRKTGKIWAKKFTVAHDCGVIVNPQGLTQTIEGNVIHGLSRAILEEVRFDANSVTSVDWSTYPIVEIQDAPLSVDVVLINHPEIAPTGAGEPTIRSIPAAIANAFFDATGVRLRTAPMTSDRVLAALAAATKG